MTEFYISKTFDFEGDPLGLFTLFKDEPFAFFLDSSLHHPARGRFSFIGFGPFKTFIAKDKDALSDIQAFYQKYVFPKAGGPTPFPAGLMGYLGYDFGFQLENVSLHSVDDLMLPDYIFGCYDSVITIDHLKRRLIITSSGLPETKPSLRKQRARWRLEKILKTLQDDEHSGARDRQQYSQAFSRTIRPVSNMDREAYFHRVRRALQYIGNGDIYQVNLSQRFCVDRQIENIDIDPLVSYKNLREISPSPFGAYFDCGKFRILSNSPERFLKAGGRTIETRPMKGTRPRGKTPQEDILLKKELLQSPKDTAELLMITDLLRNDLGRVCSYGSVRVQQQRALEQYATVFQTTANITGILEKGKGYFDLIRASFPGGSITGCPKIRSMQIIEELEPTRRCIYTGALGYISCSQAMDFNILIRTLLFAQDKIYFQVGGGIVADSTPEGEYNETMAKAQALNACLGYAREQVAA